MNNEAENNFTIINALGLHARAAAQLVKIANRHPCEVHIESDGQSVNGKSIMGVLMLAAGQGTVIRVICKGSSSAECLKEIESLILNKFGESE